ncbi:MAG: hypothetical protein KDC53_03835, partial [Saprospiraceae bacterium]|nr:hypothetical protein [Saprospiraceae bacterium]
MELKFAWIDEYKNIKAQGYNFSPMERFAYDPASEILSFEDTSKEAIDGFFGEHFLNVTAIIGENGSGKSNLIEFVLSRIASFGNGYFIGFNNLGKEIFVLDKTIISSQKVNFSNKQSLEEEGFTFSSYKESVFEAFGRLLEAIQEIGNTYIFYSPTLDFRDFGNGLANLYDFSTNTLFYSDQSSDPTVYRQNEGGFFPDLSAHVFMEVKRHLDFISAGIKDLPFKLPKNLNIKVVRFSKNRFLSKSTEWIETNNLKVQYEYLELFERDLGVNTADKSGKFKQILASSFLGLLMANYPEPFSGLQREDLRKWIYDQEFPNTMGNDDLDEKLGELKDYFQILKDITESFPHSYLNRNRENHPDKHEWELNNEILIECSDASIENIKKLHSTYNKITDSKSLQNFYWGALSSGERNLLNLFSR